MIRQRTIKEPVEIEGTGLQTGKKVRLRLKGSPANSGINFIRVDLPNKPLLNIQSLGLGETSASARDVIHGRYASADSPPKLKRESNLSESGQVSGERRTTLGMGPIQVQTIEHLLAALSGLSIDNIVIEVDNIELPGLDGSAKNFLEILKKAKVTEQNAPKRILKIDEAVWCKSEDALLAVFPDKDFRISYVLSYDSPSLGTQFFSIILNEERFESDVSPARTFCLEKEAPELLKRGLGLGANYENTLVIGENGPVNNTFRFPNEPVRHKILDLIGDLYLLGMSIKGHVVAIKSGHGLNMELVRKLKVTYGKRKV